MSKKLIVGAAIVLAIIIAMLAIVIDIAAFERRYADDTLAVDIKVEYKGKFLAEGFTADDFEWDNIKGIEQIAWYEPSDDEEYGLIYVYLKKPGVWQIRNAKKHFESLEFVQRVGFDPMGKLIMPV